MAVDTQRVKDRFKAKYGTVSLSNQRLDALAAKLAPKIADEAEDGVIDGELDDLNEIYPFLEMKKAEDRAVNDRKKQQQEQQSDNQNSNSNSQNSNGNNQQQGTEPKSEIDELKELVKSLAGTVNTLQSQKQAETVQQRTLNDERLKNIPKSYIKAIPLPTTEEDIDGWITSTTANYQEFAKEMKLAAFGNDAPPSGQPKNQNEVSADMKAYMATKKPAAETGK